MAVLATKLDSYHEDVRAVCKRMEDQDGRLRAVETEQVRLRERQGILTGINTAISAGFAVVAGLFGASK